MIGKLGNLFASAMLALFVASPLQAQNISSNAVALADQLLVDGDPIAQIDLFADPAKNLLVVMKDGRIEKNIVAEN